MLLKRTLLSLFLLAVALAVPAQSKDIELDVKETRVGDTLILDFMGNKRAAHGWRLVKPESRGLDLLEVSTLGWILSTDRSQSLFRSLDTMRFVVRGKTRGQAELVFEHNYRNVRGHYIFKRKKVRIIIKPAALQKTAN